MTVKRMDNGGIVVEDLDAAVDSFTGPGLQLEGRAPGEGECTARAGARAAGVLMRTSAILSLLLCACVPTRPVQQPVQQPVQPGVVERALRAAAGGAEIPADLVVRYSDMHGMHGGTTITLTANGAVRSSTVDPRTGASERRGAIPPDSVRAVIQLLVELAAWEQRTPPRQPVPDESAAGLTIRAGGEEVRIWEWYNEMGTNARLIRVLGRLRSFATDDPSAPPAPPG